VNEAESQGVKNFRLMFGPDFDAKLACSKIYKSFFDLIKAISSLPYFQPGFKANEFLLTKELFPHFDQEKTTLKELEFLLANESSVNDSIVVDDLSHDSFSYLVSYLQRLLDIQVQRQISVNKKANEESKKDQPKNERLMLI
jgi:hypothetical protein